MELKNNFRKMQGLLHPDKFVKSNDTEKTFSLHHSSYLNKAYSTLRDPLARANYLLKIYENGCINLRNYLIKINLRN